MAILDPTTAPEKTQGVADIHQKAVRFLRKKGLEFNVPNLTKTEYDEAIADIWDALESINYRAMIGGRMANDMPEDKLFHLFFAVAQARHELLVSKLPPRTGA